MIKVDIKNKISFPSEFVFQGDLMHIAKKIIIPYLVYNIDHRINITGSAPQIPDCDNTIDIKKAGNAPYPDHPLLGFDLKLRESFFAKTIGKNEVLVSISEDRKEIAHKLQVEGVVSRQYGRRWFRFFAINPTMEAEAIDYIKEKINKLIGKKSGK